MSDFSDDDLPEVVLSHESPTKVKVKPYHIDLSKEIKRCRLGDDIELQIKKIEEDHQRKDKEDEIKTQKVQQDFHNSFALEEHVPDEPPGCIFLKRGAGFCQFNADTLVIPSLIRDVAFRSHTRFYQYLRNILQEVSVSEPPAKGSQGILTYLLFLLSVHSDQVIVELCLDLLLEFNSDWEINHKLLLSIFENWGADIDQVLPSFSPFNPRVDGSSQTVPPHNVNAVLKVLAAQLELRDKVDNYDITNEGSVLWNVDELVFGLLVLLSLDAEYVSCYPAIQDCMCRLLSGVDRKYGGVWVTDYCEVLLCLVTNDYNLTSVVCRLLTGSPHCETLRLHVSFGATQKVLGVPIDKIRKSFDFEKLKSLIRNTTKVSKLKDLEVYCLLIFLDTILRHPGVAKKENLESFRNWLSNLERKLRSNSHVNAQAAYCSNFLWSD